MTVKASMPALYAQLKKLPWKDVPGFCHVAKNHRRRTRRIVKAVLAPARAESDGAAQVAQVRRTVTRKGNKTAEVVHVITSDAGAAALAARIQGHRHTENKLRRVRDVTCQQDSSPARTPNAPCVTASPRNLAISLLRLDGHASIAAANRHHARDPRRTLTLLQSA